MQLSLQQFSAWVSQQAAAAQAAATQSLDFTVGSILRVLIEANASVALWLQWLIVLVQSLTRASTSVGADLDSWMADFSFVRQQAVAATGSVTFSRFTATNSALVSIGSTVKTADGTQQFAVTVDATNSLYSATLGGYLIPAGTASGSVPVAAVSAGTQGNVNAGTITLIASALSGIDTVTNASALANGIDAQTDASLRAAFWNYINTRSLATAKAVGFAISQVGQNLTWTIAENANVDGSYNPGHFTITVDDGSGHPSAGLLTTVSAAVDAVRPVGSTFLVQAPSVVNASVTFALTVASGYVLATLDGGADLAVTAYINGLPLGAPLPYLRLAQVIYDSSPGITNVKNLLVNGATADIGGGNAQVVRVASVVGS